jgi:predicted DNA repair protein MutK
MEICPKTFWQKWSFKKSIPGHVVVGMQQLLVVGEHLVEVGLQEVGHQHLVPCQHVLHVYEQCFMINVFGGFDRFWAINIFIHS